MKHIKQTPFNKFKLRDLRRINNLTTAKLGELINISHQTISKWENGIAIPSRDSVTKLAKIFDVSIDFFFDDMENNNDNFVSLNRENNINSITCALNELDDSNLDTLAKVAKALLKN